MNYGIHRDSGCLQHHGILGQKWGVRRFQNPDGTLTEDGLKRYRKSIQGNGYLNPSLDDHYHGVDKNRRQVMAKYSREYWNKVDKGVISKYEPTDAERKLWEKYKTQYYKATLKDLKLHDTKKARELVKQILEDTDPAFYYDTYDESKLNNRL